MSGEEAIRRSATVKDVARHAGVSASTVSNVLHGRSSVASTIRERVEAAIRDVGYVPSSAGRLLRSGQSEVILLAVPDIRSPYYSSLAHTVIKQARTLGLSVTIAETGGQVEYEREVAASHPNRGIAGVLMCPVAMTSDDLADLHSLTPMVLLGEHTSGYTFDQVAIDSAAAADTVATHLLQRGRRRVAVVGADLSEDPGPATFRLRGVRRALDRDGLHLPDEAVIATSDSSREAGEAAGRQIPIGPDAFDAIFCITDELAIGVLHALRERGIHVPADVAITGWDDSPESRYATPTLTTVGHDLADVARSAITLLLERRSAPGREPQKHIAAHHLIARESTAGD